MIYLLMVLIMSGVGVLKREVGVFINFYWYVCFIGKVMIELEL